VCGVMLCREEREYKNENEKENMNRREEEKVCLGLGLKFNPTNQGTTDDQRRGQRRTGRNGPNYGRRLTDDR